MICITLLKKKKKKQPDDNGLRLDRFTSMSPSVFGEEYNCSINIHQKILSLKSNKVSVMPVRAQDLQDLLYSKNSATSDSARPQFLD